MRLLIATFVALTATTRAQITQLCEYCPYDLPCRGPDGGCYEINSDTYECAEGTTYCLEDARCRSPDGECQWENYDYETGDSQCPEGTTLCPACINSILAEVDPNAIDDGCPLSAPVCVDDAGDSPPLGDPGSTCVAKCFDTSPSRIDQGCPQSLPFCTSGDGSDPGRRKPGALCGLCGQKSCGKAGVLCSACSQAMCDDNDPSTEDYCIPESGCHYWDGSNSWGPVVDCEDTSPSGTDKGCSESQPICTLKDGSDPGAGKAGVMCSVCSRSLCDDNDPSTEDYCYRESGCYHSDGSNFWGPVVDCVDTSPSGTDKGCSDSQPICTLRDRSDPGAGNAGVQCSVCSLALCDDGDSSTDDFCDPQGGCNSLPKETCGAVSGGPQEPWMCGDPLSSCTRDDWCYCITDVEGNPFCAADESCLYVDSCTSSDECGSGRRCVSGCCGSALKSASCLSDCGSDNGYGFRRLHGEEEGPTVLGFRY